MNFHVSDAQLELVIEQMAEERTAQGAMLMVPVPSFANLASGGLYWITHPVEALGALEKAVCDWTQAHGDDLARAFDSISMGG
jgi:hypothetical protein